MRTPRSFGASWRGLIHFVHAALPKVRAVLLVAFLERFARFAHQAGSVPNQSFGLFGIVREDFFADLHSFLERSGVARQTGEEVVADLDIETVLAQ